MLALSTAVHQAPLRLLLLPLLLLHQPVSTFQFIQLPFRCKAGRCRVEETSGDFGYKPVRAPVFSPLT